MKISIMTAALVGSLLAYASMAQTTAIPRSTNSDVNRRYGPGASDRSSRSEYGSCRRIR